MVRSNEVDIFLKQLAGIYYYNPNLEISSDTIYDQLRMSRTKNNKFEYVEKINISNVQNNMRNRYGNDSSVHQFSTGYFWVVENYGGVKDYDQFKSCINNSIKMYVSVDENNIEYVATNVIEFMKQNNIVTQSKISKSMRNDALVLRVGRVEDAKLISNYINNELNYECKNKPNPFLYNEGNVSIACDGTLSFNSTICDIMSIYIANRKESNSLGVVGYNDFVYFLNNEYRVICGIDDNEYKGSLEQIKNGKYVDKYHYRIGVYHILLNNLNGNINSMDFFKDLQNIDINQEIYGNLNKTPIGIPTKNMNVSNNQTYINYVNQDLINYNFLISALLNYYDLNSVHKIIGRYISNGDINNFTRREYNGISIRGFVFENFNPKKLNDVMNKVAWMYLVTAYRKTYAKHGYEQTIRAVTKLLNEDNYNGFTNDDGIRAALRSCTTLENLKFIIYDKLSKLGNEFNVENITECLLSESFDNSNNTITIGV